MHRGKKAQEHEIADERGCTSATLGCDIGFKWGEPLKTYSREAEKKLECWWKEYKWKKGKGQREKNISCCRDL